MIKSRDGQWQWVVLDLLINGFWPYDPRGVAMCTKHEPRYGVKLVIVGDNIGPGPGVLFNLLMHKEERWGLAAWHHKVATFNQFLDCELRNFVWWVKIWKRVSMSNRERERSVRSLKTLWSNSPWMRFMEILKICFKKWKFKGAEEFVPWTSLYCSFLKVTFKPLKLDSMNFWV